MKQNANTADLWRLFVALPLPDDARRELLGKLAGCAGEFEAIRSKEPYLHITLVFLGQVVPSRTPDLISRVHSACEGMAPLRLRAEGLGTFGGRVLWAGLKGNDRRLRELAIRMSAETREFAGTRDERPFVPHLTLARRGVWPRASRFREARFEEMLGKNQATVFARWVADRVILFRSELQPKGARYTALSEVILTSSSAAR